MIKFLKIVRGWLACECLQLFGNIFLAIFEQFEKIKFVSKLNNVGLQVKSINILKILKIKMFFFDKNLDETCSFLALYIVNCLQNAIVKIALFIQFNESINKIYMLHSLNFIFSFINFLYHLFSTVYTSFFSNTITHNNKSVFIQLGISCNNFDLNN